MSHMQTGRWWLTLAVVTASCIVVNTAILVRNTFWPGSVTVEIPVGPSLAMPAGPPPPQPPVEVDDWKRVAGGGHRMGPADAAVTIVEFSDFECPACRRFASETFPALQQRFPGQLALVYRHYPLRSHAAALPAARAAECAASQGRFEAFHDVLFAQVDSLRGLAFRWLAGQAGVADLDAFDRCAKSTARVSAIEADLAEVRRIGGQGTPTLVVNGMLIRPPYSPAALSGHIQAALTRARY
jgi:protein-disulfide isomerase